MTSLLYLRKSSNYFYTLPVYLRTSHYCLHSARCMRLPEPTSESLQALWVFTQKDWLLRFTCFDIGDSTPNG